MLSANVINSRRPTVRSGKGGFAAIATRSIETWLQQLLNFNTCYLGV